MSWLDRKIEPLRRQVRSWLPHSFYETIAAAYDGCVGIRKMGWRDYKRLRALPGVRTSPGSDDLVPFDIDGLLHPIRVRPGTADAREVIHSIIRQAYGQYIPSPPIRLVVDAGAYIGDTSCWYASRFPRATIIALEPDPENFRLLSHNSQPYGERIVPLQAALWPRAAKLRVCPASLTSGVSVVEAEDGTPYDCLGLSPSDILEKFSAETIDILKCDIEGAELELFSADCGPWLERTRSLAIEIHTPAARESVLAAARRHGFSPRIFRDLCILERP